MPHDKFTEDEIRKAWKRAGGMCECCEKELSWKNPSIFSLSYICNLLYIYLQYRLISETYCGYTKLSEISRIPRSMIPESEERAFGGLKIYNINSYTVVEI